MKRLMNIFFLFISFVLCCSILAQEEKKPPEMSPKVYEKVVPAIVKIFCENENKVGSGSLVGIFSNKAKKFAVVLTACHVVASNFEDRDPKIELKFHNDIKIKLFQDSTLINAKACKEFSERANDIALIIAEVPKSLNKVISYYKSSKIKPGQIAAGFGFPETDNPSQPLGQIIRIESQYYVLDRKLDPGTSGGPLVDKAGRMIGIVILTLPEEGYSASVNIIEPIINNWLNKLEKTLKKVSKDFQFEKRWKFEKYIGSEKYLKDPKYFIPEILISIAIGYGIWYKWIRKPKTTGTNPVYGKPPMPPVQ